MFVPCANGHSVHRGWHGVRHDFLAIWMLTGLSCVMVTGELRPAAWCEMTWVTGSSRRFGSPSRVAWGAHWIRSVWKGAVRVAGADFDAVASRCWRGAPARGASQVPVPVTAVRSARMAARRSALVRLRTRAPAV